jgi:multiple sugar transport system ATP-binding protein
VASVTFEGVTKRYDEVVAVDDLDLAVDDGEFMVLLGPSGCGKTTALRMIAGLEEITSGTVRIGDRVVNDVEPAKRDVSMVFQSYALYPHMTVRRNIESPLIVRKYAVDGPDTPPRKLTKAERAGRVDEAAAVLDLTPYLDRKPAALSGGQRQRVALARAFVGRPQAFLMDEPLSNLDAKLRAQTRLELVDLHRRVETTVVYVTHDQVEAMTMATRIAVMAEGHLQQVGTAQQVYEAPANLFVARFIGTPPMNTLPGRFTSDGGWPAITVGDDRFPVPPEGPGSPDGLEEGRPVVVGVRPEHLLAGLDGAVTATVTAVEWLGHECLIFARVGDHPVTVREPGLSPYKSGDVIKLSAEPRQVHLFDPETTSRLT